LREKVLESLEMIRKGMPPSPGEFKNLGLTKDGIYKRLEFAIGLLLDELAEKAREHGITAISYADVITSLGERGLISGEVIEKAEFLARLREILVYDYELIDDEIAFENMPEYLEFIETVLNHLEGRE